MSAGERGPFDRGELSPLGKFNLEAVRAAREAAGEPLYMLGDPDWDERPFTEEYDDVLPEIEPVIEEGVTGEESELTEDLTPSADARSMYKSLAQRDLDSLRRSRISAARTALEQAQGSRSTDIQEVS